MTKIATFLISSFSYLLLHCIKGFSSKQIELNTKNCLLLNNEDYFLAGFWNRKREIMWL